MPRHAIGPALIMNCGFFTRRSLPTRRRLGTLSAFAGLNYGSMSVELDASAEIRQRPLTRPIDVIARATQVDPRIPAVLPGFDAPFFQAGLAGYSDGAMRLIARRHGCPF